MDFFTLFGLPPSFDIDLRLLTERFQAMQSQYHPDRFAMKSESERLHALQQASAINDGYQTLKNPLSRAQYLLTLHGCDPDNEQQTLHDTAFLMAQMALHEELEQIESMPDALSALAAWQQRLDEMLQQRTEQLRQQLNAARWSAAAENVRRLRFLVKLRDRAHSLEEKWLDD